MKRIPKRIEQYKKLLSFWSKSGIELRSIKDIVKDASKQGLSERTVQRYLKKFVEQGKFKKVEQKYNDNYYMPTPEFWENIMSWAPFDFVNPNEQELWDKAKDRIAKRFVKTMKRYEKKRKLLESGNIGNDVLSPKVSEKLDRRINNLFDVLKDTLIDDYFVANPDSEQIYELLGDNVASVLSAYMELWAFVSVTPSVAKTFRNRMEKVDQILKDKEH